MDIDLINLVQAEEKIALDQWGEFDTTPERLLNVVMEEVGEVAHAINHKEHLELIKQEIVESIGVLSRLYDMVTA